VFVSGAILAAAAIAVYGRTFSVPLIYDDYPGILNNSTIRHWGTALSPPVNTTPGGRPILNLSLAINYAIGGTAVWSYHAFNLAIHVLAGLALFGIVRRTLARRADAAATAIAFSTALLWTLHPLQTEAVTYIVQRAESLMGLFYLLTLYCFIRGVRTDGRFSPLWFTLCVASCLLGMGTKEVMVSAPLIVLLYDRTFVAGSFREASRRRWRLYGALGATWLVLAYLILASHGRGGTAGSGSGVAWWRYALTQLPAIAHYLRLSLWPNPLILDYGTALVAPSIRILPGALVVMGLAAATLWALVRKPAAGFLGAGFFAILAPSSSIIPVATEPVAEHRMYLALVPVVVFVALGIHRWLARAALPVCLFLAACLGLVSARRNHDYSSLNSIWSDTAAKRPENERAHIGLGNAWLEVPGHLKDAIGEFEEALRLKPDYAEAHNDLGNVWLRIPGGASVAIAHYREALRLKPDYAEAHVNLGSAWYRMPGRLDDAIAQLREALRLRPDYAEAHYNLGNALLETPGHADDAIAEYKEALRLKPDLAEAHYNLATTWSNMPGRANDAVAQYEEALRLKPDYAEAHNGLGGVWLKTPGRSNSAVAEFEEALRLKADYAEAHYNLGNAWMKTPGRADDAIAEYKEAVRLNPGLAEAHNNLGGALYKMSGHLNDAIAQYEEALRLKPDYAEAHYNLGNAWLKTPGRASDAIAEYKEAVRLNPNLAEAHNNLGGALSKMPGHLNEAIVHFEEAVRLNPDNPEAHFNLASAWSAVPGRLGDAIGQYEEAVRLKPDAPEAQYYLAVALLKIPGRSGEAKAHLESVLRLQPDNDRARKMLSRISAAPP